MTALVAVLAAVLAGTAAAAAVRPRGVARLHALLPVPFATAQAQVGRRTALRGPTGACILLGAALLLLFGGVTGVVLGAVVALLGPRALAGLECEADRAGRRQLAADLPMALDLLAACLSGGAGLTPSLGVVAGAVPGAVGDRLHAVAAALDVGTPPAEAWRLLAAGQEEGLAAAVARTLQRASEGGAPVAEAMNRLAEEARDRARSAGAQAAARAGVLVVGPLGLCFLPAFVLLGVVPVVIGLVGPVLRGL